jgi:hypothetical protein
MVNYESWVKDKSKIKYSVKKHPYKTIALPNDRQHAYGVNCIDSPNFQTYKFKHQVAMGNIFFKVEVIGTEDDIE